MDSQGQIGCAPVGGNPSTLPLTLIPSAKEEEPDDISWFTGEYEMLPWGSRPI
ncbi:hypothetical protein HZB93_01080 [Candidatus Falkowbacteria bacterium]|nr:hypothetical protein [Candidatus Falkowbacteria bacterium]